MTIIIPMAGEGSRFRDAGYHLPKALVPVSGKPMIVRVLESLPPADRIVCLVRQEHIDAFHIDELIKRHAPNAVIVPIAQTTEGQASTCMLAMPHISPDEPIFIAACDNSFLYNKERHAALIADPSVDAIVWTFTQDELLTAKPEAWGWVRLADDGATITDMSVKVPVSDNPFNDHAVVATFYFKRAGDFVAAYERMVAANYRINNEFYVDALPIFMNQLGKRCVMFDVDLYVGWGKPADMYVYDEWEYRCRHLPPPADGPLTLPSPPRGEGSSSCSTLWKQYFDTV